MLDELILRVQALVDRAARWARLRQDMPPGLRRFLIVQIDGLSREALQRALSSGQAPAIAQLIAAGRLRWRDLSVGIPSSTPAFQAALMYGVHPDIPGFHWYDKRERADFYFPRPGVAALVEERHARGRRGIMEGGACYGCVFTGGAAESLWTMSRALHPTRAGAALLRVPLSGVLVTWVIVKCLVLTATELTRALLRLVADPLRFGRRRMKWLLFKISLSIWTRQIFTLATSADLYRGVPAVYVNYLEYDVFAHAFGPHHPLALRALRRVDRSIGQLARILRRLPESGYDLYVLSDHGQTPTRPFDRVSGGASIEATVLSTLARLAPSRTVAPAEAAGRRALPSTLDALRRLRTGGLVQHFLTYLERDFLAFMGDGGRHATESEVRVVAAGPNAFVYFIDSADPLWAADIERRYPGIGAALSEHPGVGFVLARSPDGPVCWHEGKRLSLGPQCRGGPFDRRPDREVVLKGLRELMAMPSAGDLVLYGIGAPAGDVSFLDERGAHAGPSPAELDTFILHPPNVTLPDAPLTHPVQLYRHFAAYHDDVAV
jgi:type I phosphodiesterase/nucleotide pyrophosphatase